MRSHRRGVRCGSVGGTPRQLMTRRAVGLEMADPGTAVEPLGDDDRRAVGGVDPAGIRASSAQATDSS